MPPQIMLKVVVYAVKLKLEFYILNILSRRLRQNAQNEYTLRGEAHRITSKDLESRFPRAHPTGKEIAPVAISYENSGFASNNGAERSVENEADRPPSKKIMRILMMISKNDEVMKSPSRDVSHDLDPAKFISDDDDGSEVSLAVHLS